MRRGAVFLTHALTFAVPLGLGRAHADFIGRYEFTGTYRFAWLFAYGAILSLTAYAAGIPDAPRSLRTAVVSAVAATVAAATAISLIQLALGSLLLPRYVVAWSLVMLLPAYVLASSLSHGGRGRAEDRDRVLVVAGERERASFDADVQMPAERPFVVVGAVDYESPILETATATKATVLVLDRAAVSMPHVVDQSESLHRRGVRVRTLSLFYEEWLGKLPLSELERASLMFDIGELHRAHYSRVKRLLDISIALLGFVVLVPLSALVFTLNPVVNSGPLLYRQERVGRGGKTVLIHKFRTMRPGGSSGTWAAADDSRVTPGGRFLRRTHLDELPQIVDVLMGRLSLVGPRPEQPTYVEQLRERIPFYDLRHLVQPGITGWAQVKFGYARTEPEALEKLQYDFFYLRHQSLWLDLKIMGRTTRQLR